MVSGRESGIRGSGTLPLSKSNRSPNLVAMTTLSRTRARASPTSASLMWGASGVP